MWDAALQGAECFYYFGTLYSAAQFGLWGCAVFLQIRILLQGRFNRVSQMILKDTKFAESGKSAG